MSSAWPAIAEIGRVLSAISLVSFDDEQQPTVGRRRGRRLQILTDRSAASLSSGAGVAALMGDASPWTKAYAWLQQSMIAALRSILDADRVAQTGPCSILHCAVRQAQKCGERESCNRRSRALQISRRRGRHRWPMGDARKQGDPRTTEGRRWREMDVRMG